MIDLHTHSNASDGVLMPEALVQKAKEIGLSAMALTDHDQVSGVSKALESGKKIGLEVVPGVELSSYWQEKERKEFHTLGYFINWEDQELKEKLTFFQEKREERAKKILRILRDWGYLGEWENLQKIATGSIGMPHIARTCFEDPRNKEKFLKEFGGIPQVNDFVQKYMLRGKPAYVEKTLIPPKEAIDLIHKVGGVAVLAHPCFDLSQGDFETIKILKEWGIEGLEALAPFRTPELTKESIKYFSRMAKDNNLLVTGGSDYHGIDGIGAGLGFLEWGMEVPDEILTDLKNYKNIQ
ncbi:MAG: PHP domain-containing protein [Patescibacteria group bacterium]|nr:PHP domain-containing protein [Patescibacteria group bacterium]